MPAFAAASGASIHYELHGPRSPGVLAAQNRTPLLCFVPGLANYHTMWEMQIAHFATFGTVLVMDLPGAGRSTSSRVSMASMAEDLVELLVSLQWTCCHLVGERPTVPP